MWFVGIGLLLLGLKLGEVGPVAELSWWWVPLPFVLAVLWWAWADSHGYTQRKAMERLEAKKQARRQKAVDALKRGRPGQRG